MTVCFPEDALQEASIRLWCTVGSAARTISRPKLRYVCAGCIHRLGRRAVSPMEEYRIELFLASSARSFATYSSEFMSLEDGMLMRCVAVD
jgi:hypothetical protein